MDSKEKEQKQGAQARGCCSGGPDEMKTGWSGRGGREKLLDVGFILKVEPADLLTDSK